MWNNHATSAGHVNHMPAQSDPPVDPPFDESATRGLPFVLSVYDRLRSPKHGRLFHSWAKDRNRRA